MLITKTFDEMTNDILTRITSINPKLTNTAQNSVLRTIVESIVAELDIFDYRVKSAYDGRSFTMMSGQELDDIFNMFGVYRDDPTYAKFKVKYFRETPSTTNIIINNGCIVSTQANENNEIIEVEVINGPYVLAIGESIVEVDVRAKIAGNLILSAGQISVLSTSITGIPSVTNEFPVNDGKDTESDDEYKEKFITFIRSMGKANEISLKSAIEGIVGVTTCEVLDQKRGIATCDLVVTCDILPPSAPMQATVLSVAKATKAAGINIGIIYPTITPVNITITLSQVTYKDLALAAVLEYINGLGNEETLFVRQLESAVIIKCGSDTLDITTTLPAANVVPDEYHTLRAGTITINGEVMYNG